MSELTCPECYGALWEESNGEFSHYRCRTGHAFSQQSLLSERGRSVERAFWVALLALREKSVVASRMAGCARKAGQPATALRYEEQSRAADEQARILEELLDSGASIIEEPLPEGEPGMAGQPSRGR